MIIFRTTNKYHAPSACSPASLGPLKASISSKAPGPPAGSLGLPSQPSLLDVPCSAVPGLALLQV
jgi:hypothetical protein